MSEEKRTLKVIEAEYNKKAKELVRVDEKLRKELMELGDEYKALKFKLTPVRIEIPINMDSDGNECIN